MRERERRRRRGRLAFVALSLLLLWLGGCAALFDSDDFDRSRSAADGSRDASSSFDGARPSAALSLARLDGTTLPRGGSVLVSIQVDRNGVEGEIDIRLSLPPGMSTAPALPVIDAGASRIDVVFHAGLDTPFGAAVVKVEANPRASPGSRGDSTTMTFTVHRTAVTRTFFGRTAENIIGSAFDPTDNRLYLATSDEERAHLYREDPTNGLVTPILELPFTVYGPINGIAINPKEHALVIAADEEIDVIPFKASGNGELDITKVQRTRVPSDFPEMRRLVVLEDGRMLLLRAPSDDSVRVTVLRVMPNGEIDRSFDQGVATLPGFHQITVAATTANRTLVAGRLTEGSPSSSPAVSAMARLLDDAGLDPSFGDGGIVKAPVLRSMFPNGIVDLNLINEASGAILVTGIAASEGTGSQPEDRASVLASFTSNSGATNVAFGDAGVIVRTDAKTASDVIATAFDRAHATAYIGLSSLGPTKAASAWSLLAYRTPEGIADRSFGNVTDSPGLFNSGLTDAGYTLPSIVWAVYYRDKQPKPELVVVGDEGSFEKRRWFIAHVEP